MATLARFSARLDTLDGYIARGISAELSLPAYRALQRALVYNAKLLVAARQLKPNPKLGYKREASSLGISAVLSY